MCREIRKRLNEMDRKLDIIIGLLKPDFSKEDKIVLEGTKAVHDAQQRIPHNQEGK